VVQESVNNIVKHAQASSASVAIRRSRAHLLVTIVDNGRGFETTGSRDSRAGGFGLLGISERVHLLGGTVCIESTPGAGTTVAIDIATEGLERGV
jgi:signal transduction histidine kinase